MKRWFILFCSIVVLMMAELGYAYAGVREDYEEAYKLYFAAGACVAVYNDRIGSLAARYMEQDGWKIDRYVETNSGVAARFLLAQKSFGDGRQAYVLAIVGTETAKDVQTDLKMDKVYFAGSTLEEFSINAARRDMPATVPKVHRGFHEYVQAGLTAKIQDADGVSRFLTDLLLTHPDRKIYLAGHSLGGAAAVLCGARLISMGVRPEQIEVITFGAPAVGNAAFAARFAPSLNSTRVVISGDPVTGILQTLAGGYKQFGREIRWDMPATTDQPHKLTEYVDLVIKNYYQKRLRAAEAGAIPAPRRAADGGGEGRVYIAPLKNNLPAALKNEFWYMQQALQDEYRKWVPGYVFGDGPAGNWRLKAAAAGCKWLVIPEVKGHRLKEEHNTYYITLYQTVYDVATGTVIDLASSSTGTYNLTPLEALIHNGKTVNSTQPVWLNGYDTP